MHATKTLSWNPRQKPICERRLHTASDYAVMDACAACGSILTPLLTPHATAALGAHAHAPGRAHGGGPP